MLALAPAPAEPATISGRVVGDGEWIVLGSSEEESFESMSATPTLRSEGFVMEIDGRRVEIARGTQVEIRAIEGARRAPLEAMTTGQGLKTRFTFEVRPGTLLFTEAATPQLHAYRDQVAPQTSMVLAGSAATVLRKETAFPGCWMMIMVPGVFGALGATLLGWSQLAWALIAGTAVLLGLGYTAMPSLPKPR
jgi:hypothetical protein